MARVYNSHMGAGTACKPYAVLFDEGAWRRLADLFRKDLYRLHSMPLEAQLSIHLQVSIARSVHAVQIAYTWLWKRNDLKCCSVHLAVGERRPIWSPERDEGAAECHASLQAGLSALKTPQSYSSTSSKEDPLSTEVCQSL